MYPHERSLVKRFHDQPFALIGVNSDKCLPYVRARRGQEQISWRSFWNGPLGTAGPISTRWGVTGWPTIYVLDQEGVIRSVGLRGEQLDAAIDKLLTGKKP
ncbi:MAG: TlpA family protein disulfide reductase [Planctomycetota bacterium]